MSIQILLHLINEHRNTVPTHLTALVMEVEILISHIRYVQLKGKKHQNPMIAYNSTVTYLSDVTLIRVFDRFFISFLTLRSTSGR